MLFVDALESRWLQCGYGGPVAALRRDTPRLLTIGLTGGIGSGKSTVAAMLRDKGAHLIDADKVGHEAYEPGTKVWQEVVAAFGRDIVGEDGGIDRKKLGPIVFGNPEALQRLNSIVHPRMREMIGAKLDGLRRAGQVRVAVVEAAILIEADWVPLVDEVWVTTAPEDVAVQRVSARNGFSPDQVRARIRSQLSNEERIKHAARVIDTDCTLEEVRAQIDRVWVEIEPLAGAAGQGR